MTAPPSAATRPVAVRARPAWARWADGQSGVLSRRQALECGLSPRQVDWLVRSGRWVRLHPAVFATHTGPVPNEARVWAALLVAGDGAVASGRTALWLWRVVDDSPPLVEVCVPARRSPRAVPGVVISRRRRLEVLRHPAATPPRLRVEDAVLDVADAAARVEDVVDVVVRAVQRRVTTAERLRQALGDRHVHRHRRLLRLVLEDVVVGVRSALEREYLRGVERAHGLPAGTYNPVEQAAERRLETRRYRDVRYEIWALVVELDGAESHRSEERHREHRRDNAVTVSGRSTLRYGWRDVAADPCGVADEVAQALRVRGWGGRPTPCGPTCPMGRAGVRDPHITV